MIALEKVERLDTLLVAAAPNAGKVELPLPMLKWLRTAATRSRRYGSVCTGAFILAATGLVDGRRIATHWAAVEALLQTYPSLRIDEDALDIRDGKLRSSFIVAHSSNRVTGGSEMSELSILLLPGLGDSGPDHWQTHWEGTLGYERIRQRDWDAPNVADWVACLNERICADTRPKILVAHSLACSLVAHWARAHRGPVVGALLVAPSDVDRLSYSGGPIGFAPMPLQRLPFCSTVVSSDNDIYVSTERGREFAEAWGAKYILIHSAGHIGSAAKLGMWEEGQFMLQTILEAVDNSQPHVNGYTSAPLGRDGTIRRPRPALEEPVCCRPPGFRL